MEFPRRCARFTALLALVGSLAAFSQTQGQSLTEFPLPSQFSRPAGVSVGPDGAVWFTETLRPFIGRIGSDGSIAEFPLSGVLPSGRIAAGPDGALWFPVTTTGNVELRLGRITTSGVYSEIPLRNVGTYAGGITTGPDGALWLGAQRRVLRVTPGGSVTEIPVPSDSVGDITLGLDGNIWFSGSPYLGKITPAGEITTIPVLVGKALEQIAAGPDGNLWVGGWETCSGVVGPIYSVCGAIARVTPAGAVSVFTAPDLGAVVGMAKGSDGNLWFTAGFNLCVAGPFPPGQCLRSPSRFGRITPDGVITQFDLSPDAGPGSIVTGTDGNLWFAESSANRIARVAPSSGCLSDIHSRCLNSNRFRTEVSWRVERQGSIGLGTALTLTEDTAAFWFFTPNNLEVVVKVVDGRLVNGSFWVFIGALSDVEYEVTVTDSLTGAVRRYANPAGTLRSVADTSAF